MSLEFREITPANWREIKPEVKEEQKEFVAPYTTSLARAYVYRKDNSIVFAIYHGKDVVGLLMQRDYLNESGELICILDQFLIDKNFQDQGFGEAVMRLWLAKIKSGNMYRAVELCFIEGAHIAEELYRKLGFTRKIQSDDGNELVMEYILSP